MPAAVTDKFTKGPANKSTTLSSSISDSIQTIPLSDVTGVPTDTAVYMAIDAHDSAGTETPSTAEVVKGVISGSNLINATRGAEGTAQAHDAGAVVEFFWTAAALGDITDGILVEHNQDGTHSDITADSIVVADGGTLDVDTINEATAANGVTIDGLNIKDSAITTANVIDSDQYIDGSIDTAHLADDAVTDAKQAPKKRCILAKSAAQNNITDATWTAITFDVETSDADGWHDAGSNTERITPTEAGLFFVTGQMAISGLTAGVRVGVRLRFYDDSGASTSTIAITTDEQVAGQVVTIGANSLIEMAVGDYVFIEALHANGDNTPDFTVASCKLELVKLSD